MAEAQEPEPPTIIEYLSKHIRKHWIGLGVEICIVAAAIGFVRMPAYQKEGLLLDQGKRQEQVALGVGWLQEEFRKREGEQILAVDLRDLTFAKYHAEAMECKEGIFFYCRTGDGRVRYTAMDHGYDGSIDEVICKAEVEVCGGAKENGEVPSDYEITVSRGYGPKSREHKTVNNLYRTMLRAIWLGDKQRFGKGIRTVDHYKEKHLEPGVPYPGEEGVQDKNPRKANHDFDIVVKA